jgi:hypothetical protein
MTDLGYRGRSRAESAVVHAVWDELGGELVEEFVVPTVPGDPSRARNIDGVFVAGERKWHRAYTPLALRDRDVTICQAKAGVLDFGVLGQTLFGAELIDRHHRPASLRLVAAAVNTNPVIEELITVYRPNRRVIEHRTYPHLPVGKSSGAEAKPALRQVLVETLHRDVGGLLIFRAKRGPRDFGNVRVGDTSLRFLEMNAVILPARRRREIAADAVVEIDPDEPVGLVYTCSDLYMTAMGRAVFAGEYARSHLGLGNARSFLRYGVDNSALRELLAPFEHVVLPAAAAVTLRSRL